MILYIMHTLKIRIIRKKQTFLKHLPRDGGELWGEGTEIETKYL